MTLPSRVRPRDILFWAAVAGSLLVRIWLSFRAPESYDITAYWRPIAGQIRAGIRLYEGTAYHFLPPWAWVLAVTRALAGPGPLFAAAIRTLLTAADAATALLVFRLARREGIVPPRIAALLFLWNPVSIWVSAVQGQFDNLAILFLLAALLADGARSDAGSKEPGSPLAAVGLALSLAAKQIAAFHPLLWWRDLRGRRTAALSYGAALLFAIPYAGQWRAAARSLAVYRSVPRSYGLSEFVLADSRWGTAVGWLSAASALAAALWLSRFPRVRSSLALFLVLLLFAPGMGAQYLVWPVALGAVLGGARFVFFTAAATAWILGSHFAVPGSGRWMGQLVWLAVGLWLSGEVRVLLRARQRPGRRADTGEAGDAAPPGGTSAPRAPRASSASPP